jgi:diguanylate cyclase (GGDEF)-like protein/PAS domain S-box-containing protein
MEMITQALPPRITDLLLDAVFLVDMHGRIVYVSAACERILGYTPEEMTGRSMIDFVAPEDREKTRAEAAEVMSGKPRIGFENRYLRKDGTLAHIMWSARWSEADQLRIGVARDITERKHAEERQAAVYAISEAAHATSDLHALFYKTHQIIAALLPVAGFAVAIRDSHSGQLDFVYQADAQGRSSSEWQADARRHGDAVLRSGLPALRLEPAPEGNTSWLAMPLAAQQEAGGALILQSRPGTAYADKDVELLQFVSAQVAAAIERSRLNAELLHAARYDELTGLPNRRLFQDRMQSALARCRRSRTRAAMLYVDIDNFKVVNDSLGHAAGDRLLKEFACRLVGCVREQDTVARLGGDEFVVLLENVGSFDDALSVAEKIHRTTQQPLDIEGHVLQTMASIGIALYPDDGLEAEALLRHADKAMYLEKQGKAT